MTPNVVGVVCALAAEARHVGPGEATRVAISGMGEAAAARAARALIEAGATGLVSWGMAGGLDPTLQPGAIVLPGEVISPTGAAMATDRSWYERLGAALGTPHEVLLHGRLITSPKSVGTRAEKAALFRATGAAAVDMESLAIASVARDHKVPFIAVRVIVDTATDELPRAVTVAADKEGHLRIWRLLAALARTPGDLGALIRLGGRYRAANRSLAAVARLGLLAVA